MCMYMHLLCDLADMGGQVVQNERKWPVHIARTQDKGWGKKLCFNMMCFVEFKSSGNVV